MKARILTILIGLCSLTQAQTLNVIASHTLEKQLATDDIKSIFIGEHSFWEDGKPICVVLPHSKTASFDLTANWALESDGFEYQKHWLSLVFQGRANAPVFVKDEVDIIDFVTHNEGCIGVLHFNLAPSALRLTLK
jgi:uncharacterized membrane protein YuzA (DUF378 family)